MVMKHQYIAYLCVLFIFNYECKQLFATSTFAPMESTTFTMPTTSNSLSIKDTDTYDSFSTTHETPSNTMTQSHINLNTNTKINTETQAQSETETDKEKDEYTTTLSDEDEEISGETESESETSEEYYMYTSSSVNAILSFSSSNVMPEHDLPRGGRINFHANKNFLIFIGILAVFSLICLMWVAKMSMQYIKKQKKYEKNRYVITNDYETAELAKIVTKDGNKFKFKNKNINNMETNNGNELNDNNVSKNIDNINELNFNREESNSNSSTSSDNVDIGDVNLQGANVNINVSEDDNDTTSLVRAQNVTKTETPRMGV